MNKDTSWIKQWNLLECAGAQSEYTEKAGVVVWLWFCVRIERYRETALHMHLLRRQLIRKILEKNK